MDGGEPTERLPAGEPWVGELIAGRYRLETLLGSGGSADVWRARDDRRARTVTLKILRRRDDPATRREFLAEAELQSTLAHPSFVPVLGIQDSCGVTCIAFEHVEGEALDTAAARMPIPPRGVAGVMLQLAEALEALHARGFLHLDLKPANVLLSPGLRVRVLDLGIAEPIGGRPQAIRGTLRYVAPEVRAGAVPSRASDVYGLAIIAREVIGPARETRRVSRVLRRGLDPDPSRRYQRPRPFAMALAFAVLVDEELAVVRARLGRLHGIAAGLRAIQHVPHRAVVGAAVAGALLMATALPSIGDAEVPRSTEMIPTLTSATFELPPRASYDARFESQAPYPRPAAAGTHVAWVIALRNTGSAGWYRGVAGAQASLALDDGTTVAVQSTAYVGPGQVGWFVSRIPVPAGPGTHVVVLHPQIQGLGRLPDLGIYAVVTSTDGRAIAAAR